MQAYVNADLQCGGIPQVQDVLLTVESSSQLLYSCGITVPPDSSRDHEIQICGLPNYTLEMTLPTIAPTTVTEQEKLTSSSISIPQLNRALLKIQLRKEIL